MLFLDFELYIPLTTLVEVLEVGKSAVYKTAANSLEVYEDSRAGKCANYTSLPTHWQQQLQEKYKDYKSIEEKARFDIVRLGLSGCPTADRDYFYNLVLPSGRHLEAKKRKEYELKAELLDYVRRVMPLSGSYLRKLGLENKADFWALIAAYATKNSIKVPKNNRRLTQTVRKYMLEGASALVSGKLCNTNREKIGDTERQLIIELFAPRDGRKFSKRQVWRQFKMLAGEHGWTHCENITYQRVAQILKQEAGEWEFERNGSKNWMLNKTVAINRRPSSGRNVVWQLDGTPESLWYYDPERNTIDKLYVLKVMDSRTWKIVGYSIGYTESSNLVFEAMKMACTTLQIKPLEVRSDKGSAMQSAETKALMAQLGADFYPTATGNARAKSIESWQSNFNEQVLRYYVNASGGNITVKDIRSKQNPDKLKKNYKDYPHKQELVNKIRLAMAFWDNKPRGKECDQPSPNEAFETSKEKGRPINLLEQFELFSIWRKKGKNLQSYPFTIEGLTIEIGGRKYRYLPQLQVDDMAAFLNRHIDQSRFFVKYDPSDLKQIAVYQVAGGTEVTEENMRFVIDMQIKGQTAETNLDATEEEKQLYNKMRRVQKMQLQLVKESTEERRTLIDNLNLLGGGIELQRVHKDAYNKAQLQVQRLHGLGYNSEITADVNKKLSEHSLVPDAVPSMQEYEQKQLLPRLNDSQDDDNNVYGLPNSGH